MMPTTSINFSALYIDQTSKVCLAVTSFDFKIPIFQQTINTL